MAAILVVEDRPINRKFLSTLLRSAGHVVTEASDGVEALPLAHDAPPDLVISDILMPTIDGYEFVRRMREMPGLSRTPVIFYTATYNQREAYALAQQCGVTAVLIKPSEPKVLLNAVATALRAGADTSTPEHDRDLFNKDHLHVVSSALAAKVTDYEASELRMAAIVEIAHEIAAERDPQMVMQKVCAAARKVTLAGQASIGLVVGDPPCLRRIATSGISGEDAARLSMMAIDSPFIAPVIRERRPVRMQNPGGNPEAIGLPPDHPATYTCMGVPIATAHRVYGYLGLRNKVGSPDGFSQADEEIALALATHAAIAYENARLYEDLHSHASALERRTRLVTFGADVGHALAEGETLPATLGGCTDAMVRNLDAAFARIWTVSGDGTTLELRASSGMYAHLNGLHSRVPIGTLKIGLIAQERRPHLTNSVTTDARVRDRIWAEREGMVSFAGYPLIAGDQLLGVMAMFARVPLDDETLEAMAGAARAIALGIQRSQIEDLLRTNQERTDFALGAARMGVWELSIPPERVTWSDTLAPVFGLTPAQAPTTIDQFSMLIHPDDRAAVADGLERAIADRIDLVNQFRTIWPDGTVHWVSAHARVLTDENGAPIKLAGVGMDVSERKSLEEQFRQAQKMEAVGQLAGGVAHDFNNLLTAIRGYAGLVSETLSNDDRRQRHVEEIIKAADRAARLTRQLLAFSRKQVLQPTLVDLNTLVLDTSKMLKRLIGEDVEMVTRLAQDVAPVRADIGQLEQILMNLVVNARDAMPHGGRVSIETANVMLDESYAMHHATVRPGPYVMLAVTDNGTGMDEATRARIFEPFYTTKERGRGTGLGLATVYGIVNQSEGYIWVYSEPGRGAAFKIYLPHASTSAAPLRNAYSEEAGGRGTETILLVEDEEAVRSLSLALLERAGYSVFAASDPRQAKELFSQRGDSVDLLVTDVVMPGGSGPSLYEHLSSVRPTLKVLYMSGYTDDAIVQQAGISTDVIFLQKPFTAERLRTKVREALER